MTYQEYLQSPVWKSLRSKALKSANYRCQACNSGNDFNVHHRKYPEVFGTEPVSDLIVLCRKCHKTFHVYRFIEQTVIKIKGKIRVSKKLCHYWVKGIEVGTVRALCNPGLVREKSSIFDAMPEDKLCKVCAIQMR